MIMFFLNDVTKLTFMTLCQKSSYWKLSFSNQLFWFSLFSFSLWYNFELFSFFDCFLFFFFTLIWYVVWLRLNRSILLKRCWLNLNRKTWRWLSKFDSLNEMNVDVDVWSSIIWNRRDEFDKSSFKNRFWFNWRFWKL